MPTAPILLFGDIEERDSWALTLAGFTAIPDSPEYAALVCSSLAEFWYLAEAIQVQRLPQAGLSLLVEDTRGRIGRWGRQPSAYPIYGEPFQARGGVGCWKKL